MSELLVSKGRGSGTGEQSSSGDTAVSKERRKSCCSKTIPETGAGSASLTESCALHGVLTSIAIQEETAAAAAPEVQVGLNPLSPRSCRKQAAEVLTVPPAEVTDNVPPEVLAGRAVHIGMNPLSPRSQKRLQEVPCAAAVPCAAGGAVC